MGFDLKSIFDYPAEEEHVDDNQEDNDKSDS